MRHPAIPIVLIAASAIAGCNPSSFDPPLILAKVDSIGAHAAATIPDQGASVSIGYRSAKGAFVPVTATNGNSARELGESDPEGTGAFSTFAHFEASIGAGSNTGTCLGDTFATGTAAQKLGRNLSSICRSAPRPANP